MDTVDHPIKERPLRKRYILVAIGLILLVMWGIAHTLLFTPLGNWLITPILQNKLTSALQHPITIKTFTLTSDNFELLFVDEVNNSVNTKGSYTLIPPHINALYDTNLSNLAGINTTKFPTETNGTIQGAYHDLHFIGETHIFSGRIDTDATLHFLSLNSAHLVIHNLPYQPFMETFEYPHNSDTVLNGELNISEIEKRDITATGQLTATTHHFKPSPLKENNESFDFWSLLADKEGKIHPFRINADVNLSLDELGIIEQFAHYPLRTKANIHTTLQGTQNRLKLNTTAFAAGGKIDATLTLTKLRPKMVDLTLKHADARSLFKLFSLPAPITGNIDGEINSDFINSTIALEIQKGHTVPSVLKRQYKITQPLIAFNSSIKVTLKPKLIRYSGTFKSDLKDLRFDGSPPHDQMLTNLLRQINHNRDKGEI
ncbi:MAG: hypothetical protein NTY39_09105 [Campylobacterales bacterium]|nr:hypothetical protein [Campylobacterales bacterium]